MPEPSSRYRLIAEASTAGLLFVLSPLAGYSLGKWLGEALGLGRILAYAGALLGLVSAFVNLFRLVGRATR
jgi:positive regulator of sigma E activity